MNHHIIYAVVATALFSCAPARNKTTAPERAADRWCRDALGEAACFRTCLDSTRPNDDCDVTSSRTGITTQLECSNTGCVTHRIR